MNKKMLTLPIIILTSGLMLTGCSSTPEEPIIDDTTVVVEEPTTDESVDLTGDEAEAFAVAEAFYSGTVDETTVTPEFLSVWTESLEKFKDSQQISPDVISNLKGAGADLDSSRVTVDGDTADVAVLYPDVDEELVNQYASVLLERTADGTWLVTNVYMDDDGMETYYTEIMKDLLSEPANDTQTGEVVISE